MTKVSELDEVVRLTTRRLWAMVLALLIVFGAATGWALMARIESTVTLSGMLLAGSGPALITAPTAGTVLSAPAPGRQVRPGDPLFTIRPAAVDPAGRDGDPAGADVTVVSTATGIVSDSRVRVGTAVAGGSLLTTVDRVGAPLTALVLLEVARGASLPVGATVRGPGWTGTVSSVEPYAISAADLAARYGQTALPGVTGNPLVRPVVVSFGVPSWPGATLTPVSVVLVLGSERPADLLLRGGLR